MSLLFGVMFMDVQDCEAGLQLLYSEVWQRDLASRQRHTKDQCQDIETFTIVRFTQNSLHLLES